MLWAANYHWQIYALSVAYATYYNKKIPNVRYSSAVIGSSVLFEPIMLHNEQ